jgi:hypothetical protein
MMAAPFKSPTGQDELVDKLTACFVGLPGVVGAPLIMGPDYYREICQHLAECGVGFVSEPIKHYLPPEGLRSAGTWVYNDPESAPEDPHARFVRLAEEENAAYLAEIARRKAEQVKPKPPRRRR